MRKSGFVKTVIAAVSILAAVLVQFGPLAGVAEAISRDDYEWTEINPVLESDTEVKIVNSSSPYWQNERGISITPDGSTLLAIGFDGGMRRNILYSSRDEGKTWEAQSDPSAAIGPSYGIRSVSSDGSAILTSGYCAGAGSYSCLSRDYGRTWMSVSSINEQSSNLRDFVSGGSYSYSTGEVYMDDGGTLYGYVNLSRNSTGILFRSTDQGEYWQSVYSGEVVKNMSVVKNLVTFSTGGGKIFKSTDSGDSWAQVDSSGVLGENNGYASPYWSDASGSLIITTRKQPLFSLDISHNGGVDWGDLLGDAGVVFDGYDVYVSEDGKFISTSYSYDNSFLSRNGTFQSYDGGNTWTEIRGKRIITKASANSEKIVEIHRDSDGGVSYFIGRPKQVSQTPGNNSLESERASTMPSSGGWVNGERLGDSSGESLAATGDLWEALATMGLMSVFGGVFILRHRPESEAKAKVNQSL